MLNGSIADSSCTLQVNLTNSDPKNNPILQISINGKPYNIEVEQGAGNGDPLNNASEFGNSTVSIPLSIGLIRKGGQSDYRDRKKRWPG